MKITSFHVEASSHCNARCPGCPRNVYGYNVKDFITLQHLSPERYREIRDRYPDLSQVRINGGLGDPMMNPHITKIVEHSDCFVQITTNGSIGNRNTFERLAELNTLIEFSIDGLEDTNHLYRPDVSWDKIMDRVKWFIDAGGHAVWKWVPFRHNSHQLEQAKELSKKLGFKDFTINAQGRDDFPVLDRQGNLSHWIQPHDRPAREQTIDTKALIEYHLKNSKYLPETGKFFEITCEHLRGEVYITAGGKVTPWCYHGTDRADRKSIAVDDFTKLQETWTTDHCDPTCANSCGKLLGICGETKG
jgi:MoaA/NifB/PqqE/SkfB family radical SAM enzyme